MAEITLNIQSVKRETPKAWLAILKNGSEIWFPKSQCSIDDNSLTLPDWLAKAKGIAPDYDE